MNSDDHLTMGLLEAWHTTVRRTTGRAFWMEATACILTMIIIEMMPGGRTLLPKSQLSKLI